MRRAALALLLALGLCGCKRTAAPADAPARHLLVAMTGDTWGEVEPCG